MKKILTFLLFGLIIFLAFELSTIPAGYKQLLNEKDLKHKSELDSAEKVSNGLILENLGLRTRINVLEANFSRVYARAEEAEKRNRILKNTPVKQFTDPEYDSALKALYPNGDKNR